jgi:hypothetical protein
MIEASTSEAADLLERCRAWVRRYVILNSCQEIVIAVWILHTWTIEAAECTPYLHITAPEKGCGKSRLLETLEPIVYHPCKTGGMTAAALVRTVDKERPTLLLDEIDVAFGGNQDMAEAVRGILNEGFRRGGNLRKCVGNSHDVQTFQVFSAKAIAGIGKIPDTVASRSIGISMRRKEASENVERFRERQIKKSAEDLRNSLSAWATPAVIETLRSAMPSLPEDLTDRQQDVSEPLLAIADIAGGEWPRLIRDSLLTLFSSAVSEDNSIGVQLLRDIRSVFDEKNAEKIFSAELATALCLMEGHPWKDWARGLGLDAHRLAGQLKKYGITPQGTIRIGTETKKGYTSIAFESAWASYCPVRLSAVTSVTAVTALPDDNDLDET